MEMSFFDQVVDRKGTNSSKWDGLKNVFGIEDAIPMWVADMDFKSPPEVIEAIKQRADHGMFGYTVVDSEYYDLVAQWMNKRHKWEVKPDWVVTSPGTISALSVIIRTFTNANDTIVIQPPVYPPFERSILLAGRKVAYNNLILENNRYRMDYSGLEKLLNKGAKMFILCSPHNPVGRVWAEDELLELASVLSKHEDVFVFDDELWADFTYAPNEHHPLLQVAPHLVKRTITATSASKTFNLAGLENTNLIIPDENIKSKFNDAMFSLALSKTNLFAIVATKAAYKYGEGWVDQLLQYLHENFEFMKDFLKSRIPSLELVEPEGTYLAWVNASHLGISSSKVADKLLRIGHVAVEDGSTFGPGGEGFLRVNYAMPRSLLEQALNGFQKALT